MENQPLNVPASPTADNLPPVNERQWAMFSHLSAFSGFLIPFGNIIGPLVMFLLKKDEYPFGGSQAREALNFNISCLIYAVISLVLSLILIGFVMLIALGIFWIVSTIIATIRANEGLSYQYPLTIRLVR